MSHSIEQDPEYPRQMMTVVDSVNPTAYSAASRHSRMSNRQAEARATQTRDSALRFIARRVSLLRYAAGVVISMLLCVPALTRALEHTLTAHSQTGFRFSKNIERPVEKFKPVQTTVDLIVSEAFELGAPSVQRFCSWNVVVGPVHVAADAPPVRAPPSPASRT
jgi:hypothetical protein